MQKTAISPKRSENYPNWYQEVIIASDLAENSSVRGCMVIKPWGYAIWENIQKYLDIRFKELGHVNAYFPLLIPLSYLEKEAEHVEGFAKECAVVTHHRLVVTDNKKLVPDGELEEPFVIRPTSETIIGESFSRWVKSYRDLPLLINQWANVMRWEMRTRIFLRTSEFLWQEGHTVHSTREEAETETKLMLDVYEEFAKEILAIPVFKGEKPCFERFPGAVNTYAIEAMMQDGKALQAGTSHFLGQNFAKSSNIQFTSKEGNLEYAWTTSWGVSTRLLGALVMVHSDDNGLILPPRIAPNHVVILPIYKDADKIEVLNYCHAIKKELSMLRFFENRVQVNIDDRDLRGGEKNWHWIKKGVPIRIEVGIRDIVKNGLTYSSRDNIENKIFITIDDFQQSVVSILESMQNNILARATSYVDKKYKLIDNINEFNIFFNDDKDLTNGFAVAYAVDHAEIEAFLKPLKVTARLLFEREEISKKCIFTNKDTNRKMLFAKAY